jgi:hypothetical protein
LNHAAILRRRQDRVTLSPARELNKAAPGPGAEPPAGYITGVGAGTKFSRPVATDAFTMAILPPIPVATFALFRPGGRGQQQYEQA